MDFEFKDRYDLQDFKKIVAMLRDKDFGCPWDKAQDHFSIRKSFIEETYEVIEAIDLEDTNLLKEELGDVLLQIVLHSQFEEEIGSFNLEDVINDISKKIIVRHPHVFKNKDTTTDENKVLMKWEEIKNETKGFETLGEKLNSVPKVFPALMYANKVQKRMQAGGFEFLNDEKNEIEDLKNLILKLENASCEEKNNLIANIIFTASNLARIQKMDSEEALKEKTGKIVKKVVNFENLSLQNGKSFDIISKDDFI